MNPTHIGSSSVLALIESLLLVLIWWPIPFIPAFPFLVAKTNRSVCVFFFFNLFPLCLTLNPFHVFKSEILTNLRRKWWCTKTSVYCEGFPVFRPEILTNFRLRRNWRCIKTSVHCEGFPVFKPGILTDVVLRQAFTVKVFLCLNQKY